jgi:hypothetical protein
VALLRFLFEGVEQCEIRFHVLGIEMLRENGGKGGCAKRLALAREPTKINAGLRGFQLEVQGEASQSEGHSLGRFVSVRIDHADLAVGTDHDSRVSGDGCEYAHTP